MMIPLTGQRGEILEILNSRDLTKAEWALVKKNPLGSLSVRDLPDGKR